MKCAQCGGLVTWRGPLSALTHTECENCGGINCQTVEREGDEDYGDEEWVDAAGELTQPPGVV